MYKKMNSLGKTLVVLLLFPLVAVCEESTVQPNIIIIMADDLGWNGVGYHNKEVKTPNIDKICKEGIELDNFYVSPMCSPTRMGFLTGRYPIRYGGARAVIPPWRDYGLSVDEVTLAEVLRDNGYKNRGIFGKWHIGHLQLKWLPLQRGFTDFVGCYNGAINYFNFERDGELDWHHNEKPVKAKGYATTVTGKAADSFIRAAAIKKEPFFCYIPFNAPHSPFQVPGKFKELYPDVKDEPRKTYFGMISCMDKEIGRILDTLDELQLAENTLVWFFSDNGGVKKVKESNAPLSGAKLSTFEGGVRAVSCLRLPQRYMSGKVIKERTSFIDVMPTILSLTGSDPNGSGCKEMDGMNLEGLLSGESASLPERDLYFYHGQQGEEEETIAIISKKWKLVVEGPNVIHGRKENHRLHVFNLEDDPNEKDNLVSQYPELVDGLFLRLQEFRKIQPENAVPPYVEGKKGFKVPQQWDIHKLRNL